MVEDVELKLCKRIAFARAFQVTKQKVATATAQKTLKKTKNKNKKTAQKRARIEINENNREFFCDLPSHSRSISVVWIHVKTHVFFIVPRAVVCCRPRLAPRIVNFHLQSARRHLRGDKAAPRKVKTRGQNKLLTISLWGWNWTFCFCICFLLLLFFFHCCFCFFFPFVLLLLFSSTCLQNKYITAANVQ